MYINENLLFSRLIHITKAAVFTQCCLHPAEQQLGASRLAGRQSVGQVQRVVH